MTFEFKPAVREAIPLLLGVAGGTGSGKTMSALRLARGITGDRQPFAVIDTENGRARHYADQFTFHAADLTAPFRPQAYADAIQTADAAGYPVIVVDSMSHEWAGDGGMLDWHDLIMGGDNAKKLSAWVEPKQAHRRMVTRLLQVKAHVILCFRAEPKVEMVKGAKGWEIVEKKSLTGLDGWMPISEKMLPYELTASFLLMADQPGVPKPIKLQEQHRPMVPLDQPLTEDVGHALAEWAAGGKADTTALATEFLEISAQAGHDAAAMLELARKHDGDRAWFEKAIAKGRKALAKNGSEGPGGATKTEPEPSGAAADHGGDGSASSESPFHIPESARA